MLPKATSPNGAVQSDLGPSFRGTPVESIHRSEAMVFCDGSLNKWKHSWTGDATVRHYCSCSNWHKAGRPTRSGATKNGGCRPEKPPTSYATAHERVMTLWTNRIGSTQISSQPIRYRRASPTADPLAPGSRHRDRVLRDRCPSRLLWARSGPRSPFGATRGDRHRRLRHRQ